MTANKDSSDDTTISADPSLTYYRSGHIENISLSFVNDLITLLSTLDSTFEEDLARISSEQHQAKQVNKVRAPLSPNAAAVFAL